MSELQHFVRMGHRILEEIYLQYLSIVRFWHIVGELQEHCRVSQSESSIETLNEFSGH